MPAITDETIFVGSVDGGTVAGPEVLDLRMRYTEDKEASNSAGQKLRNNQPCGMINLLSIDN